MLICSSVEEQYGEFSFREKAAYLAAFIDGEGHIGLHKLRKPDGKMYSTRTIAFCNTDVTLIEFTVQLCIDLGFNPKVYYTAPPQNKPGWSAKYNVYITSTREDVERFKNLIPIKSKRKIEELDSILASYMVRGNKQTWQCASCGKLVVRSVSRTNEDSSKRFCSAKCKDQTSIKILNKNCGVCGKPFWGAPSKAGRQTYCSRSCSSSRYATRLALMSKMAAEARWRKTTKGQ